jgi:WD40 repeat protein
MTVSTGKVSRILHNEFSPIVSLLFSPDGKRLIVNTAGDEPEWTAWDLGTGGKLHKDYRLGWSLFLLPDNNTLAASHENPCCSGIAIWDLKLGKSFPRFPEGPALYFRCVTPDRTAVIVGRRPWEPGPLCLRDLATGKLLARLAGHRGGVAEATFSDDGARLATVGQDNTVLVWDVAAVRKAQAERRVSLSAGDLESLWQALAREPPGGILEVFDRLAEAPEAAVAFLQQRVQAVTDAGLADRLADLASPVFAKRDEAMQALQRMEHAASPQLRKLVGGKEPLEVVRRAEALLKALDEPAAPHHLQ